MVFAPAVSAQGNSETSDAPSELEQGLIDALNSNAEKLSTDEVITNYFRANKDEISISGNDAGSGKNESKTYQLKDGSNITFTDQGYFFIDYSKVSNNTTQPINKKNEVNSGTLGNSLYTPIITSSISEYNLFGWKLFTLYTRGYFGYNHVTVEPYFVNSWYVRNMPFNLWQISNWGGGENQISSTSAEVYGQGNFHYGLEHNSNSLTVQNYYVKVNLSCDQNGNYDTKYSVTELTPKLKIGALSLEL